MNLVQREPLLVLAIAAVLLVLGVDAVELAETVERIVQSVVAVGALAVARKRVTPVADPRLTEDDSETAPTR